MQINCSLCGEEKTVTPNNLKNAGTPVEKYVCRKCWNKNRRKCKEIKDE